MLKVQLSIPELKTQALAIREMALDPLATLQTLVGNLRVGFEDWMNDLMKAELALHLGREPYERKGTQGTIATATRAGRSRSSPSAPSSSGFPETARDRSRRVWFPSAFSTTPASNRTSRCCFSGAHPPARSSS